MLMKHLILDKDNPSKHKGMFLDNFFHWGGKVQPYPSQCEKVIARPVFKSTEEPNLIHNWVYYTQTWLVPYVFTLNSTSIEHVIETKGLKEKNTMPQTEEIQQQMQNKVIKIDQKRVKSGQLYFHMADSGLEYIFAFNERSHHSNAALCVYSWCLSCILKSCLMIWNM